MGSTEAHDAERAAPRGVGRRDFLKWAAAAGVTGAFAGAGVLSALGYVKGPQEPVPTWEIEPGVVDYDLVPEGQLGGPTSDKLRVAQWYDYWPGKFLSDFEQDVKRRYGLTVRVEWDSYTSNEELFHWLTLNKRRYDVIFPSNYMVDLMKKANMIYTLNDAWLPNVGTGFSNMMEGLVNAPADNPYDRRGLNGPHVSVPYMWGTTGLGFRTDYIPYDEATAHGYDLLWMPSYRPLAPGMAPVDLRKKMRMLDDLRDVIGAGLKKAGWEAQLAQGPEPTGLVPPEGIQWTVNETDPVKLGGARDWLFRNKPLLFGYDSTHQATTLLGDTPTAIVNQGWSGDMMYAIQPDLATPQRVDYIIPEQGSTWWVDCAAIHSKSRNLWLAHEFVNFLHDFEPNLGGQHTALTRWNLYSSPNSLTYEWLDAHPYPNGWNMSQDPRLYPNKHAPELFRICDPSQDVGLKTLLTLYNPLWFDLAAE